MKAGLVTTHRFHFFEAARELKRHGLLGRMICGYPRRRVAGEGLAESELVSFPFWTTLYLASGRIAEDTPWRRELEWIATERIDQFAARRLDDCGVVMAMCCTGLHAGREAKRRGARLLIDRPVLHIAEQDRVLAEEHKRAGQPYKPIDPRKIAKESEEYALCDALLVPSRIVAKSMVDRGIDPGKIKVLALGADLSRWTPCAEKSKSFEILFAGNVSLQKGIRVLAEAVEKMRHRQPTVVIAGSVFQDARPWLAKLESSSSLKVLGKVPQTELRAWMSRASAFVLPSVQDGFGVVVPQAMACGTPAVVSSLAGSSEMIDPGRDGLVFESGSASDLSQRLDELAEDSGLRLAMGRAAMAKVAGMGGLSAYGEALAAVVRGDAAPSRG